MRVKSCLWFAIVTVLHVWLGSTSAFALSCTASIGDIVFNPIDLTAGTVFDTSASVSITCAGDANRTARVCPNIGNGDGGVAPGGTARYAVNAGNQLRYGLYQNASRTSIWGSSQWAYAGTYGPPPVDIALDGAGNGSANRTLYGRVFTGQSALPAGATSTTYVSNFTAADVKISSDYTDTNPTCGSIGITNETNTSFSVSATYPATCTVTGNSLNFGDIRSLASNIDKQTSIFTRCSADTPYSVGLGDGLAGTGDPTARRMQLGADRLTYGLFQNSSRSTAWGNTIGVDVVGGTGTGTSSALQVYGRVPNQTFPPVGTYTDVIVVTLNY